jgi:hypothetical protein
MWGVPNALDAKWRANRYLRGRIHSRKDGGLMRHIENLDCLYG